MLFDLKWFSLYVLLLLLLIPWKPSVVDDSANDEFEGNGSTEYVFGICDFKKDLKLYTIVNIPVADIKNKVILRAIMEDVKRQPTCVILRSKGKEEETYLDDPYSFQICVVRITYIFSRIRHNLFFYEFYIPPGYTSQVDWEMSVYGPSKVLDF